MICVDFRRAGGRCQRAGLRMPRTGPDAGPDHHVEVLSPRPAATICYQRGVAASGSSLVQLRQAREDSLTIRLSLPVRLRLDKAAAADHDASS